MPFTQPFGFLGAQGSPPPPGNTYINSVQYVSVTISAGNTTGNTSVSSPVGTYFMLWNGLTTSNTANANSSQAMVQISGTTITATRNSTSNDVTVNVCLVDAKSALVNSVQSGTISFTSGQSSNTATISSVTTNNTAVMFLGYTASSTTSWSGSDLVCVLTNSTTVTAAKQFAGATQTLSFMAIEFNGSALNSAIQHIDNTSANPGGTSRNITISSVNVNNSVLVYGGHYTNSSGSASGAFAAGALTGSTTLTVYTNANPSTTQRYSCHVVEFASGVLSGNVQRGSVTVSSGTSNTASISSVNTSVSPLFFGGSTASPTSYNPATSRSKMTLTNSTTVTQTINTSASGTGRFEVATFT